MLGIRELIKKEAMGRSDKAEVDDVRIGLGYTSVLLKDGRLGVACTLRPDISGSCTVFKGIRPLAGRLASDLIEMFDSADLIESSVALATVNAVYSRTDREYLQGDILDHITLLPDDEVCMIGKFAPLISSLKKRTTSLKIFEQNETRTGEILPAVDAFSYLSKCQVALITSTTIINNTIDSLLDAADSCREVVLLGPSTPMIDEVFKDTPVTILSGVVAREPDRIMQIVSEAGGMRIFKDHLNKVNVRL
jgi:uncharacterized protein (DUF4213/DUF364 family)